MSADPDSRPPRGSPTPCCTRATCSTRTGPRGEEPAALAVRRARRRAGRRRRRAGRAVRRWRDRAARAGARRPADVHVRFLQVQRRAVERRCGRPVRAGRPAAASATPSWVPWHEAVERESSSTCRSPTCAAGPDRPGRGRPAATDVESLRDRPAGRGPPVRTRWPVARRARLRRPAVGRSPAAGGRAATTPTAWDPRRVDAATRHARARAASAAHLLLAGARRRSCR